MAAMSGRCLELDRKIRRYRRISSAITDPLTIAAMNKLIEESAAERAELHSDDQRD